jgi:hypothetical protein
MMKSQCAVAKDDEGNPVCVIHKVPLDKRTVTERSLPGMSKAPPGLGHVTVLICPVSQEKIVVG